MSHTAGTNSIVDDALLQAAHVFFPDLTGTEAIAGHPNIAKVTTPTGSWGLHRWPAGASMVDVAFSRDVLAAARTAGMAQAPALVDPPAPATGPALRMGERLFDAREWLPGAPPVRAEADWPGPDDRIDLPVALPAAQFSAVIAAVARIHAATTSLATRPDCPAAPLSMLPGAVHQAHERHLSALRSRARREPSIQRWLATGERLLASAEPIVLAASEELTLPEYVLHLGLWPSHVLFTNESLSGLLGWDRAAVGSPLLDLAQAILRLQGWSDDAVEFVLATYADALPLSPEERRLLPAVAALDAVATTGRLLEQTFVVAETARPPTALRSGIDTMLHSMTTIERGLNTQATVGKSKRSPWRRGPRPVARREGKAPRERRR